MLGGAAPDALLGTYQLERLPSARQAIQLSMDRGNVICVPDPVAAAAHDETMVAVVGAEWSATIGDDVVVLPEPDAVHATWFADHDTRWAL